VNSESQRRREERDGAGTEDEAFDPFGEMEMSSASSSGEIEAEQKSRRLQLDALEKGLYTDFTFAVGQDKEVRVLNVGTASAPSFDHTVIKPWFKPFFLI